MGKQGKILIIDDNEDVLFALNVLLSPYVEKIKVSANPEKIEKGDRTQIEQLLINIIKNAWESCSSKQLQANNGFAWRKYYDRI